MFLSFGKSVLGAPGANTEIRLIYPTADKSAELLIDGKQVTPQKGECAGAWTLGEILPYPAAHQLANLRRSGGLFPHQRPSALRQLQGHPARPAQIFQD
jgi:hypothetical protein